MSCFLHEIDMRNEYPVNTICMDNTYPVPQRSSCPPPDEKSLKELTRIVLQRIDPQKRS